MASRKNVTAAEVRAWARENMSDAANIACLGSEARGRLAPNVVEAFHKAHKSKRYEPASERTVTFEVAAKDKAGRNIKRKVTITTGEARALLGHAEGTKGRFNKEALASAYVASQDAPEPAEV